MRIKIYVAFIVLIFSHSAVAQRVSIPSELFYYQPAASVFGSEAIWVNPAGLSLYRASDVQAFADYNDGKFAKNWGTAFTREGFGVAYRKIDIENSRDYREYIIATGFKFGGDLNVGFSYNYFKEAPGSYNKKHLWNIGFIGKFGPKLKWGVVVSNLNRTTIYNTRTETELRYSLAYRPIGSKFTFSVDALLSTKTEIRNALYVYHVSANPIPGLYLNGFVDRHNNFEVGFRVNFFQSFFGTRRSSDKKGNHRGTTFFYGSTNKRQESIIEEPKRRILTKLSGQPQENPVKPFFGKQKLSYLHLLTDIYRAADDNSIDEMVLSVNKLSIGFAQAEELRSAIAYFKSKKKE